MANIKVIHKAAVISTDLTVKKIKKLEAIAPDCLTIKNEKGEILFSIGTGKQESISKYGIVFANDSKISVLIDATKVNRDLVEELFGAALLQLSTIEAQSAKALKHLGTSLEDLIQIEDELNEDESEVEE